MQCLVHTYTLGHYVNYVGTLQEVEVGGGEVAVGERQVQVLFLSFCLYD